MSNNEYREAQQQAREHGLAKRNATREVRAIQREAIERSAAVYVLQQFEALMRSRIDCGKGAIKDRAELDMAVIGTLWEEAWMNGYEGDREIGSRDPEFDRWLDTNRLVVLTEAALRLGRREAGEEIAVALEAEADRDYEAADDLRWAAARARNIGAQPSPDATSGRTDPGMDSDLPPEPQAVREPQDDPNG